MMPMICDIMFDLYVLSAPMPYALSSVGVTLWSSPTFRKTSSREVIVTPKLETFSSRKPDSSLVKKGPNLLTVLNGSE